MSDSPTDAREQARHNASVMIAFADGKIVRFRDRVCRGEWRIMSSDQTWDWALYEFEVKPEERKPREEKMLTNPQYPNEIRHLCQFASRESALSRGWIETIFREVLPETETE